MRSAGGRSCVPGRGRRTHRRRARRSDRRDLASRPRGGLPRHRPDARRTSRCSRPARGSSPRFPPGLAEKASRALGRLGVRIRTGFPVTAVGPDFLQSGDDRISAATIIWAAGVRASPVAALLGAPLDTAGRVLVEPDLSIPGDPRIFVIGDGAAFFTRPGNRCPGSLRSRSRRDATSRGNMAADLAGRARRPSATVTRETWRSSAGPRPLRGSGGSRCRGSRPGSRGASCTSSFSSASATAWSSSSSGPGLS